MSGRIFTPVELEKLKREAKKICKREGISHVEALNRIAVREGFASWWHLQHLSASKTQPASIRASHPIVRFVVDPKDIDSMDDEFLASRGFARDEEFTDKLAAEQFPDEPWEASGWISALRFIEWPSNDLRVVVRRIEETFFFHPDDLWIGDEKVSKRDWLSKSPSLVIASGPEGTIKSASAVVDDLLPDLAVMLTNENGRVIEAMAETNAEPFGFDEGEVESAEFDDGEGRITFTASIRLAGEQDVERPFSGDRLDLTVSGVAVRIGNKWTFTDTEIDRIKTNA